ncbi:MAG: coagulation factor 5/8 type domain protein [Anaerocolumna sp.]|nr:coagulation factor 5/8 type domain protein [Anaerocolumna sp.]
MKILRRVLIILLVCLNIGLFVYADKGIKEPPQEIPASNVTVVEAPDQEVATEHQDFIKEEYSLVLPKGVNIALDKKVEASSFNDVYTARKVVDGVATGVSYWEGKNDYPNYLTVDLEQPEKIHAIRVALSPMTIWGKRTQTFSVNISNDGEKFEPFIDTKQYTFDPDTGNEVQLLFDEIEARYVQLVITENSGAVGGQVAEFEIYQ